MGIYTKSLGRAELPRPALILASFVTLKGGDARLRLAVSLVVREAVDGELPEG
jgi:hypothetical protein